MCMRDARARVRSFVVLFALALVCASIERMAYNKLCLSQQEYLYEPQLEYICVCVCIFFSFGFYSLSMPWN